MKLWVNRMYPKNRTVWNTSVSLRMPLSYSTAITNQKNAVQTQNQTVHNIGATVTRQEVQNRVQNTRQNVQHGNTVAPHNVQYQTMVQVEMVNHNQIHGEQDMRRLAEILREALEQTLASGGEGVFA